MNELSDDDLRKLLFQAYKIGVSDGAIIDDYTVEEICAEHFDECLERLDNLASYSDLVKMPEIMPTVVSEQFKKLGV